MEKNLELMKDGIPVSRKEFLEQAMNIYDEAMSTNEYEYHSDEYLDSLVKDKIEMESVIETHDFYNRVLYIVNEITTELAIVIHELIAFWNYLDDYDEIPIKDRLPIKLIINTPGGCLTSSLTIIDSIKLSKTPVHTFTIGSGYSGGFFIGICGDKRFGYPHSSYCFHEGSSEGIGGDAHKIIQNVDFYKKQLKSLRDITLDNTLIDDEEYNKRSKDDWFMTAQEALEYGVIDEICKEMII